MNTENLKLILKNATQLTHLDLIACYHKQITDTDLSHIALFCPKLVYLRMYDSNITDSGVITLVTACGRNLTTLMFYQCNNLTDNTLFAISQYCPQLTEIQLTTEEFGENITQK